MWHITIELKLVPGGDCDLMRTFALTTYEDLRKLDVIDPEFGATLADSLLSFSMVVDQKDRWKAARSAAVALQSALHSAGVVTAGWNQQVEELIANATVSTEPAPVAVPA